MRAMFKDGDRITVIQPKLSWNDKRVMAKVGHKGTVIGNESALLTDSPIHIHLDGHGKGIWIKPSYLKKIEE